MKTIKKHKILFSIIITVVLGLIATALWFILSNAYSSFMASMEYSSGEKIIIILVIGSIVATFVCSLILGIEIKEIKDDMEN